MGKGRNRGKFSEGGRMGFEPVENVGLAAKESAQEILKIFSQVHEPRVVRSRSLPSTHPPSQHPPPSEPVPSAQWVARAYLIGQRSVHGWVVAQICLPLPSAVYSTGYLFLPGPSGFHNGGGQLITEHALQQPLYLFGRCRNLKICQRRLVLELHGFC